MKVDVSELKEPLTELMEQVGGQHGRARFDEFKLWLKGVVLLEVLINLSVPCKLPFDGAERISRAKVGVVKLERRGDDLYLDGAKLERFLSDGQKLGRVINGPALRYELEAKGGQVSAKVLDTLVDHPELWPESWKEDAEGNTIYVFFWDDIFRHPPFGILYVPFGFWFEGKVVSHCRSLSYGWLGESPSATRAS